MDRKHRVRDIWTHKVQGRVENSGRSNEHSQSAILPSKSDGHQNRAASSPSPQRDTPPTHTSHKQRHSRQPSLVALARPLRSPTSLAQLAPYDPSLGDKSRREGMDANLSDQLAHMTLGGDDRLMTEPSKKRFSEDVAKRNLDSRQRRASDARGRSVDILDHGLPGYPRVASTIQRYSEDVAERNISARSSPSHSPHPSQLRPTNAPEAQQHLHRLVPKFKRSDGNEDRDITTPRPIQEKTESTDVGTKESPVRPRSAVSEHMHGSGETHRHTIDDPQAQAQLHSQGFDLQNTVDTDVRQTQAPAVVREVVQPVVSEIRHEQITREIHNHDIIHRILPIIDVEVLPARHFMRSTNGALTEIPAPKFSGVQSAN